MVSLPLGTPSGSKEKLTAPGSLIGLGLLARLTCSQWECQYVYLVKAKDM